MKDIYSNSSKSNEFLEQYQFDEVCSINAIPQSLNTWPLSTYEFNKLKDNVDTSICTLLNY